MGGVAGIGSFVAATQIGSLEGHASDGSAVADVSINPYLIALGAFTGITILAAGAARLLQGISGIAAYFTSIILASVSILLTTLAVRILGLSFPDPSDGTDGTARVLYWGTLLIFLVINAERVGTDFIRYGVTIVKDKGQTEDDGLGSAGALLILLLIWAGSVGQGQTLLTSGILPATVERRSLEK